MPVTAKAGGRGNAPPAQVLTEAQRTRFEAHGKHRPVVLRDVAQVYGGSRGAEPAVTTRQLMVTKNSLALADAHGDSVAHYLRLSEIDSVVVEGSQLLLRGCPRVGSTEDVRVDVGSADAVDGILAQVAHYKQHTYRLPLPVIRSSPAAFAKAARDAPLAAPLDLDVALWELPRREEKMVDVRPASPRQTKALLALHSLRRELEPLACGLRGEVDGDDDDDVGGQRPSGALDRPVSPPRPKRTVGASVALCAMDASLEEAFSKLDAIFVRVVEQVSLKTGRRVPERVLVVGRDTVLLCDTDAKVKRMLPYSQLGAVQHEESGGADGTLTLHPVDPSEVPLACALVADARNVHGAAASLLNALERAALDAGCADIQFVVSVAEADGPSSPAASASAASGLPCDCLQVLGGRGVLADVNEADLVRFAEEVGENASELSVAVARRLLARLYEFATAPAPAPAPAGAAQAPEPSFSVADLPSAEEIDRLQDEKAALQEMVRGLHAQLDAAHARPSSEELAAATREAAELRQTVEELRYELSARNVSRFVHATDAGFGGGGGGGGSGPLLTAAEESFLQLDSEEAVVAATAEAAVPPFATAARAAPTPAVPAFVSSNPRELEETPTAAAAASRRRSSSPGSRRSSGGAAAAAGGLALVGVDTIFSRLSDLGASRSHEPAAAATADTPASCDDELRLVRRSPPKARLRLSKTLASPSQSSPTVRGSDAAPPSAASGFNVASPPPPQSPVRCSPYTPSPKKTHAAASDDAAAAAASAPRSPPPQAKLVFSDGFRLATLNALSAVSTPEAKSGVAPFDATAASDRSLNLSVREEEAEAPAAPVAEEKKEPQARPRSTSLTRDASGRPVPPESLQMMLQRSRERAQNSGVVEDQAQSLSLQAILDRVRKRDEQKAQQQQDEEATAPPPSSSGSPKGVAASFTRTSVVAAAASEEAADLRSALQDYVGAVSLSPVGSGGSPPAPPPHHAPMPVDDRAATSSDTFADELFLCGVSEEEQGSLRNLGIRAGRHLEYITLVELQDSLSQRSIDAMLAHFHLAAPQCPDHFLCPIGE